MQNLYKYLRELPPISDYGEFYTDGVISHIKVISEKVNQLGLTSNYSDMIWELPYGKPLKDHHYNILYIFAKHFKVKLMWKNLLDPEGSIVRPGLRIIGEIHRVTIWFHFMSWFYKGYFGYEQWLKTDGRKIAKRKNYSDIRNFARHSLEIHRDTIYIYMKERLELDPVAELRLENFIKEQYKLDYKNYNTDHPEYYHAITTKFHHKRMLL